MSTDGILRFQNTKKATFVGPTSNISFDTVNSSLGIGVTGDDVPSSNLYITGNAYVSSDLALGGVLTMGTVNVVTRHSLQAVTEIGNTTSVTTEFTNPTTSLVASGNVEVNKDLTVSGNVTMSEDLTVSGNVTMSEDLTVSGNVEVGTVSGRVGIGTNAVNAPLHVTNEVERTYTADHTLNANWADVIESQYTVNTTVSDSSSINDVKVDSNGNVYITGDYRSDASVNLGNSITLPTSSANRSFFIIQYNSTGVAQWAETFTSNNGNSTGYGLAIDTNGYIYATGQTYTTTGINLGGNNITLSGSSTSKMFLIQYNSSGVPQWVKSIDSTSGYNQGKKVATDTNGHVYVTGLYNSNSDITLGTNITLPSTSSDAIFTIKYNSSDGSIDWAKTIITGDYNASGDITTDSGDYIYVTASYQSGSETNLGNEITLPSSGYTSRMCVIKYDPNGTALWANVILSTGTGNSSNGNGITSDSMGNIYVTGKYASTTVVNLDNGNTLPIPSNGYDIFVLKYKSDGTTLNATSLGINNGGGNAIVADTHGHVYVSGYNDTTTMYTAKLNTFNLTILKTISFTNYSFGNTITVDSSGNVYTGGTVNLVTGTDIDLGNNVSLTRTLSNSNDTFNKVFGYIIRYDINTTTKNVSTLISDGLEVGAGGLFVDTIRGRVGVATTSPSTTLDVNGTITGHTIGIGTTDPKSTLDVAGTILSTDSYRKYIGVGNVSVTDKVYLGRFSTYAMGYIEIGSEGNAKFSVNKFEITRHYDDTPYVNGINGDHYHKHEFFYVSVDSYYYDLWHTPAFDGTNANGNYRYRIRAGNYSFPEPAPSSTGALEVKYGLISKNYPGGQRVGIGTNNPDRTLDVHGAARPSGYPFAVGGTASSRARYVAVEVNPGNNKTLITKDFVLGGARRPGWVRVHAGAAAASSPTSLQYGYYAEFTITTLNTDVYSNRQTGDSNITIESNSQTNGFQVRISSGSTNGSYPRAWIEVYSEAEVYW
jgi:cytoskeletal protein CcmA (bactofilin family)